MPRTKKTDKNIKEQMMNDSIFEGKVPPHSKDLEMNVIGGMLIDNSLIDTVISILDPDKDQFYVNAHNIIYKCICSLRDRNQPADLVTVTEELKTNEELEKIGGPIALTDFSTSFATLESITYSAEKIRESWVKRDLIGLTYKIREMCMNASTSTEHVLNEAQKDILDVTNYLQKKDYSPIKKIVIDTLDRIEKIKEQNRGDLAIYGVPSGYFDLDKLTGGFQNSELIVIAGRPSHGKSAFALNIARNAAKDHKKNIGIFSLEMSINELANRFICLESKVNIQSFKTGNLSKQEWDKISENAPKIGSSKIKIYVDESSPLTLLELRAKARRMKAKDKIDMIIIDYLQLMDLGGDNRRIESRYLEIGIITRSLKQLAKELEIPIIALSQLSRKVEDRSGIEKKPQLSDLRESGSIEQDADVVIFINRPELYLRKVEAEDNLKEYEKYVKQKEQFEGLAEIIIGKQRNGPVGQIKLTFIHDYTGFGAWSSEKSPDF